MPANTPNRGYEYPLYTDTQDFPAQIQQLAEDIDADVSVLESQIQGAKNRPSVRIVSGTNQNIATSTNTLLTWSTTSYDNDSMSAVPTGIVLNDSGVYWIAARYTMNPFGSGLVFGIATSILSSVNFIGATRGSIRGVQLTPTYVSIGSLHYTTGAVPDTITIDVRQESGNTLVCGFRELSATKISNLPGGS